MQQNGFQKKLLTIEMKNTKVKMNKPIYLGLPILEISKTLTYKFWYMDTDNFTMHIKTKAFYKDIADDVEKRFDTSNYEINKPLPIGKNKKVIRLMKDELGGRIMTEFVALRPKPYSYLRDDRKEEKKAKGTKKCVTKRRLKFNNYKCCLLNNEIILKSQQRFKSEGYNVYTEEVSKIALSRNDDKRLQNFDRITSYPYGIFVGKVCKTTNCFKSFI